MKEPPVLRGYRRELTKELFEDLAALQCEPAEILGHETAGRFFSFHKQRPIVSYNE